MHRFLILGRLRISSLVTLPSKETGIGELVLTISLKGKSCKCSVSSALYNVHMLLFMEAVEQANIVLNTSRLWDWLAMQFSAEAVVDTEALHHFCVFQRRIMRDKPSHVDLPVTTKEPIMALAVVPRSVAALFSLVIQTRIR